MINDGQNPLSKSSRPSTAGWQELSAMDQLRTLLNADLHDFDGLRRSEAAEYYKSVCGRVVEIISRSTSCANISVFTTGFEPGYFSRLLSTGDFQEKDRYATNSNDVEFISNIQALSQVRFEKLKEQGATEIVSSEGVAFYLFGRGEIFGFILMRHVLDVVAVKEFFRSHAHEINAIFADQAFSYRMNSISEPLLDPTQTEHFAERFGNQVAELTTRGFGADGSTFRLFSDDELRVVGSAGHVNEKIIAARKSGEQLSGLLFDSPDNDWAAIILSDDDEWNIGGLQVPENVKTELRSNGLYSVLMCKLHGRNALGNSEIYGTLSYYFLRTTAYSRRDVSLFKSFAERVSDYLTMHYSYTELQQKKNIIELQGRIMTFSEVANLLAHDIWHKSNALSHDAEVIDGLLRRSISRERLSGKESLLSDILNNSDKLVFSANALQETTGKYKKLQQADSETVYRRSAFTLQEVIDSVKLTLQSAMDRRKIKVIVKNISSNKISGPKFLFEQVLFNLTINSIDAISSFKNRDRGGSIEISSHVNAGKHIIRFQDTGPGIDYAVFPDLNGVFDIGKTTKETGSGTGLTIARQLLGSHFSGDLLVSSRRPTTFTIVVPS